MRGRISLLIVAVLLVSLASNVWFMLSKARDCNELREQKRGKAVPEAQSERMEEKTVSEQSGGRVLAAGAVAENRMLIKSVSHSYGKVFHITYGNAAISRDNLTNNLQITPAVDFYLDDFGGYGKDFYCNVRANFKPGTEYTFRFKKGMLNTEGASLEFDHVFNVKMPDLEPMAKFLTSGPYYPQSNRDFTLPLQLVNPKKLSVTVHELYENNVSAFGTADFWDKEAHARKIFDEEIKLTGAIPLNEEIDYPLNLEAVLGGKRQGVFLITVNVGTWNTRRCEVIISDLGVQSVFDDETGEAVIIVGSLKDGTPVSGAEISAYSNKNQLILQGKTDENGIATCKYLPTYEKSEQYPVIVIAKTADDLTYLHCNGQIHDLSVFGNGGRTYHDGIQAFVYPGRGVCRPGEKILVSAFVRQCQNRSMRSLSESPCFLSLVDPNGKKIQSEKLTTTKDGFISTEFQISAGAMTGNYRAVCSIADDDFLGETNFLVTAYMPDRIKVTVNSDVTEIKADDEVNFNVSANYYFGQTVSGAKLRFELNGIPAPKPRFWGDYEIGEKDSIQHVIGPKIVNDDFNGSDTIACPSFLSYSHVRSVPMELCAQASVGEPGGRMVTAVHKILCLPFDYYLGLKYAVEQQRPVLDMRLLCWQKDAVVPMAVRQYTVKLERREWKCNLKKVDGLLRYEWNEVLEPVEMDGKQFSMEETSCLINLPSDLEGGSYRATVSSEGTCTTSIDFWHWSGEAGARSANPSVLSVKTDKEIYKPGEIAKLTVTSFGNGSLAVVSGDSSLDTAKNLPVIPGKNEIEVKIPEEIMTTCYNVGMTLVVPGNTIARSFALARLKIDLASSRLKVEVEAPEQVHPSDKIDVTVKLADHEGNPRAGSVHVFGVDEGILSLTNFTTPDIFDFFYGPRFCDFNFADIYSQIFPDIRLGRDGHFGGGGSENIAQKKLDFTMAAPALFNLGLLDVDESGKATAHVELPKHTGAMRIMAVAVSDTLAGHGDAQLVMRDSISVLASAPRAAAVGDVFELSFNLFNNDLAEEDCLFEVFVAKGDGIKINDEKVFKEVIAKGRSINRRLKIRAVANGRFEIGYKMKQGGVEQTGTVPVVVRPVNPPMTIGEFAVLKPGKSAAVTLDGGWEPGSASAKVTVQTNEIASYLSDSMGWLNEYPYGCLEQTTAAAFPFLAVHALEKIGVISREVADTASARCSSVVGKLMAMRIPGKGFGMWPGSNEPWKDGTVFVAHFLALAKENGLADVSDDVVDELCRVLSSWGENASSNSRGFRAYCSLVLGMLERKNYASTLARNVLNENDSLDMAAFIAAVSLIQNGQAAAGFEALENILQRDVWITQGEPLGFCDETCRIAFCLALLTDVMPEHSLNLHLASLLMTKIKNDGSAWGTTQANAWSSFGLAHFAAAHQAEGSARLEATLNGKLIHPDSNLEAKAEFNLTSRDTLLVKNTGASPLFYHVSKKGVPTSFPEQMRGWTMSRRYINEKGIAVKKARQGDLLTVVLTFTPGHSVDNVVLCDILPGGLEIEDSRLATRAAALPNIKKEEQFNFYPRYLEKMDDRCIICGNVYGRETCTFTYTVRAVGRGTFKLPVFQGEAMYAPEDNGVWREEGEFIIE